MHKIFNTLFSKTFILLALVLLQLTAVILLFAFASVIALWVLFIFELIGIGTAIYIINSHSEVSYKLTWIFFILVIPSFGVFCYLIFANKKLSKKKRNKINQINQNLEKVISRSSTKGQIQELSTDEDRDAYTIANYLEKNAKIAIYRNTHTTFFGWGEDAFPIMLEKLRSAKHFIFMEYFIIDQGEMWSQIQEILIEKAKEGLDIRLLYDDFGCLKKLPNNYDRRLRKYGIKAFRVNKLRPILDAKMNNRDHRKIMVIDGCVGFTGGINLADEYINRKVRFGKWKDNAIMLEGEAVFGLTSLFLSTYMVVSKESLDVDYKEFLPENYASEHQIPLSMKGYVQCYGTNPGSQESIGEDVYINLCLKAKKYIYIATPYLIPSESMLAAIKLAAKNGVQVKLLMPHIPDKKTVFNLSRSYYGALLRSGVKIYEYMPGFVHSKVFVVDGVMATVGTVNLDYRSLFLHYENGVFLYKCDSIRDIELDFETTLNTSMEYTLYLYSKNKWYTHLFRSFLRIFAPLL